MAVCDAAASCASKAIMAVFIDLRSPPLSSELGGVRGSGPPQDFPWGSIRDCLGAADGVGVRGPFGVSLVTSQTCGARQVESLLDAIGARESGREWRDYCHRPLPSPRSPPTRRAARSIGIGITQYKTIRANLFCLLHLLWI